MSKLVAGDDFTAFAPLVAQGPDAVWQAMRRSGVKGPAAIRGLRYLCALTLPQAMEVIAGGAAAFETRQEAMARSLLALDNGSG